MNGSESPEPNFLSQGLFERQRKIWRFKWGTLLITTNLFNYLLFGQEERVDTIQIHDQVKNVESPYCSYAYIMWVTIDHIHPISLI